MAVITIVEDVCEATPELFREALLDRLAEDLTKIAEAKGLKELLHPIQCERIQENLFEYVLTDIHGKEVVVVVELRPFVVQ